MPGFESSPQPREKRSPPPSEKLEPLHREVEYRDRKGNVGRVMVELDQKEVALDEKTEDGKPGYGREVIRFSLSGPRAAA